MEVLLLQGLLHGGHGLQEDGGVEQAVQAHQVGPSFGHPTNKIQLSQKESKI